MAVSLADVPADALQLEDYLAAVMSATGAFVEQNVEDREDGFLELDVVALKYASDGVTKLLGEAKSGKWRMADLFKLLGWMTFLEADAGCFAYTTVTKTGDDLDVTADRMANFGVRLLKVPEDALEMADEKSLAVWRFSKLSERRLRRRLVQHAKSNPSEGIGIARGYQDLLTHETFFVPDSAQEARRIYDAYMAHPRLSQAVAREMEEGAFDPASNKQSKLLQNCLEGGKPKVLQSLLYLEHRARVALLRCAAELVMEGRTKAVDPVDLAYDWGLADLPQSFKEGLQWLKTLDTYWQVPVLWQHFLWSWGGFLLEDRLDAEMEHLSKPLQMEPAVATEALTAFDRFFPTVSGWWFSPKGSVIRRFKMMPLVFCGIGVYRRKLFYDWDTHFKVGKGDYSAQILASMNNTAVEFLS